MTTFLDAYKAHGPDVEKIAKETGLAPSLVDRFINRQLDNKHKEKIEIQAGQNRLLRGMGA